MVIQNDVDRAGIRLYLLGTLTPDLQQKLEERLLSEPEFLEQLEIEEDELIEEYLADELSREERDKFARHFVATTERQQHLRFAVALRRYVAPSTMPSAVISVEQVSHYLPNRSAILRVALAFGLVLIVAGAFWLYRSRNSSAPTFAALTLNITLDNNRAQGVESEKVRLTSGTDYLKLTLRLPAGAAGAVRYRITLDNLDSARAEPRSFEPVEQNAQSIVIVLPVTQLKRGRYALKVFAIQTNGSEQNIPGAYYFEVD